MSIKKLRVFSMFYVYFEYNLKKLPGLGKKLHSIGDAARGEKNPGINSEVFLGIFPFKLHEAYAIL